MTKEEIKFLIDLSAFVEYCIRHEVDFKDVLSNIMHDLHGIISHGGTIESAKKALFLPKTTGDAQRNLNDLIGDSDDKD